MASAGARAYNGGLGAVPPAGSRGRAPGQGVRGRSPPEAESFLAFGHPTKATKFAYSRQVGRRIIIMLSGDNLHFEGGKLVFMVRWLG